MFGNFHHIGLACSSIVDEVATLAAIGYVAECEPIADPIQKVRLQFFVGGGPRIELVEPMSEDAPVCGWLKRGAKLYHTAYEVSDLEFSLKELEEHGFFLIVEPVPAVAFEMRRIAFLMSPSRLLIELIEARKQN